MNATITKKFFSLTNEETRQAVLDNIANHYRTSTEAAFEEVTHDLAEPMLDYVTGPLRVKVLALYLRHDLPLAV